jgi:hypothetical protein
MTFQTPVTSCLTSSGQLPGGCNRDPGAFYTRAALPGARPGKSTHGPAEALISDLPVISDVAPIRFGIRHLLFIALELLR